MTQTTSPRLLRGALRANAAFSFVSAVAMFAFNRALMEAMGIGAVWLLPVIGGGLALFAADLLRAASRAEPDLRKAVGFVVADALWVVGSCVVIALPLLTAAGDGMVAAVAGVVLAFAVLQGVGVRRSAAPRGIRRDAPAAGARSSR